MSVIIISTSLLIFSTASGSESLMPQWIKNNAKWWSQGAISDSEYIQGIQYLISQGIIKIPISQVVATTTAVADTDRAQSIVVHITFDKTYTFNTFSKLTVTGQTVTNQGNPVAPISSLSAGQFQLESTPSKDKKIFYDLVSKYINPNQKPSQVDVNIDVITGDGKTLETLQYSRCVIISYFVYTNTNKEEYRLSNTDGPELRDVTSFLCEGFHIVVTKS